MAEAEPRSHYRPTLNPRTGKAGSYQKINPETGEAIGQPIGRREFQKRIGQPLNQWREAPAEANPNRIVFSRGSMGHPISLASFRGEVDRLEPRLRELGRNDFLVGIQVRYATGEEKFTRPPGGFIDPETLRDEIDEQESLFALASKWANESDREITAVGKVEFQLVPLARQQAA